MQGGTTCLRHHSAGMQSRRTSSTALHPEQSAWEQELCSCESSLFAALKTDMAETQSVAGAKGYKQLCDVIVLVPIVHVDSDRERYSVICTHQSRGVLGAAVFIVLSINCTNLWPRIRVIAISLAANGALQNF